MPDNQLTLRLPQSNKARWIFLATGLNLLLFAAGIYTWVRTASLHLPLSQALPAAGTVLPLVNLAGLVHALCRRGTGTHNNKLASRRPNAAAPTTVSPLRAAMPIIVLLLVDTVLLTLSGTHLSTGEGGVVGTCEQQQRWQALFRAHDGDAINHIQNALQCCGFRNKKDMPFPFPAKGAVTCDKTGNTPGCAMAWAQAERTSAALLMALAGVLGIAKLVSLVMLQRAAEKAQRRRDMEDEAAAAAAEALGDGRNGSTNGGGAGRLVEEVESEFGDDDDDDDTRRHRRRPKHLDASERTPLIHDSPWAENGSGGQQSQPQQSRQQQHGGNLLTGDD